MLKNKIEPFKWICMDGIALVVNPENDVEDISTEQIKDVYTGTITEWSVLTK